MVEQAIAFKLDLHLNGGLLGRNTIITIRDESYVIEDRRLGRCAGEIPDDFLDDIQTETLALKKSKLKKFYGKKGKSPEKALRIEFGNKKLKVLVRPHPNDPPPSRIRDLANKIERFADGKLIELHTRRN